MAAGFDNWDRTIPGTIPLRELSRLSRAPIFEQIGGPGAPKRHPLTSASVVIGRLEGDIRIASAEISRTHLRLERVGSDYVCTDLDSSNGVYLNGVRVHSAVLREGDQIQLGDVVFLYLAGF